MQLSVTDLQKGDILLKYSDGSIISKAISAGQSFVGQTNNTIVHAGLLCDQVHIVEAQGSGITLNNLLTGNKRYAYHVYRCNNRSIAAGAGTCAKMLSDIHKRTGAMSYSVPGAAKSLFNVGGAVKTPQSMDDLLTNVLEGRNNKFFCSQFVVYVYQFTAEQNGQRGATLFNINDAKSSPSTLASILVSSPNFTEVGVLLPNTR